MAGRSRTVTEATAQQLSDDEWAEVLDDFPTFASFLEIETKERDQATVPFSYDTWHVEQREFEAWRTGRDVVLKSRQIGFTTQELARDLHFAIRNEGVNVLVVCHQDGEGRLAKRLLRALKLMAESLRDTPLLPDAEFDNLREWTFPSIRSSIRVEIVPKTSSIATSRGAGQTIHRLHGTEVAKWGPNALPFWNTVEGSLVPGAEVVLESTADGHGNFFHRTVEGAREGTNGFKFHFWPWFRHKSYRADVPAHGRKFGPRTRHEEDLVERHKVTPAQLAWWQAKVAQRPSDGKVKGGERLLVQEYPADPDQAFLASGAHFFSHTTLEDLPRRVRPPLDLGGIKALLLRRVPPVIAREVRRGHLALWGLPPLQHDSTSVGRLAPGTRFVVGADVSEGVALDESAFTVWSEFGEYVARWHGQLRPKEFAALLNVVGRWFGNALLGVERNNHGHAVLLELENLRYPNLWPGAHANDPERFKARFPWASDPRPGWVTSTKTRPLMLDHLEVVLEVAEQGGEGRAIPDLVLVSQCKTFTVNENGKPEAETGSLDDVLVAAAIGEWLRHHVRSPRKIGSTSIPAAEAAGVGALWTKRPEVGGGRRKRRS